MSAAKAVQVVVTSKLTVARRVVRRGSRVVGFIIFVIVEDQAFRSASKIFNVCHLKDSW